MCARYYAQLAVPYYEYTTQLIARFHPWQIVSVEIANDPQNRGSSIVLLKCVVFRNQGDPRPAAIVVSRVQVGEVIETPLIFWGVLLALLGIPSAALRWWSVALGIPLFLGLEALTTVCQLIQPMVQTSAILAGPIEGSDPLTPLMRWCRFLEGGGRYVIEVFAAILTVAIAHRIRGASSAVPEYGVTC
jgi:hypothetical protein